MSRATVNAGHRINVIGSLSGALLGMLAIASVDYATGHEISLSAFYLLPVGFLAWRTNLPIALGAALFAAILWFGADVADHQYSHPLIGVWNALVRFSIFVFAAITLSRLRRLLERERALARIDANTGAYTSRAFMELLEKETLRSKRTARPFAVVFIDLDRFKALNDRFGHAAGNEVLREVGDALRSSIRGNDAVGRIGGDEFAVLLTEANEEQARHALSRLQEELSRALRQVHWSSEVRVTASLGAVVYDGLEDVSSTELLHKADALMYEAKRLGGNRLALATSKAA